MFQIVTLGKCEKKFTIVLITVYRKLTKIPLYVENPGNIKVTIIKINPEYIKTVIKGETIVVAIIPMGLNAPKKLSEIGAVITCAPRELENEVEICFGKKISVN